MKPLLVSSGEPAGIGPDICLSLAQTGIPLVILADPTVLEARAKLLHINMKIKIYKAHQSVTSAPNQLTVLPVYCADSVIPGQLNVKNAAYVMELLKQGVDRCLNKEFSALVTAPVHKAIINKAGISFTGHTEYMAERCKSQTVVMMLVNKGMRVALITTHLPLKKVAEVINEDLIIDSIEQLYLALQRDFNIVNPGISVAGLNPHAGESGYLGREEIAIIFPALEKLRARKWNIKGPLPADTMFVNNAREKCDAFVAMYHDQGLPVLKYSGFNQAVNITLGLPIIRTSVDHGTALELAGSGQAEPASLLAAVNVASKMALNRQNENAGY